MWISLLEPFAFATFQVQSPFNDITHQGTHSLFVQYLLGNKHMG